MYRNHTVGVVIPAYNEEAFIGDVIHAIPEYVDRVFCIDDCSTDDTWVAMARAAGLSADGTVRCGQGESAWLPESDILAARVTETATNGRLTILKHGTNRGAGGAVKTGYLAALTEAIDITVTVDGDGQMDLSLLEDFLDPIVEGEAGYTKGNRLTTQKTRAGMPRFRLAGNVILSSLTKIASGYWNISDSQNGYTAISLSALERIEIPSLYEYYGYCNDVLARLNVADVRVIDIPMQAVYADEESGIRYRPYITHVSRLLLRSFVWRMRTKYLANQFHPLICWHILGTILFLVGTLAAVGSLFFAPLPGIEPMTNAIGAAMILLVLGSLSILIGILVERQLWIGRLEYET